ncbi:unnamed protein product [Ilex paraguariensis]|uniref:SCP domain-containing protein n=1 Tax=Ilex paraguariensis TaxID=185542 RepID=A0ABC8SBG2_9AQUA
MVTLGFALHTGMLAKSVSNCSYSFNTGQWSSLTLQFTQRENEIRRFRRIIQKFYRLKALSTYPTNVAIIIEHGCHPIVDYLNLPNPTTSTSFLINARAALRMPPLVWDVKLARYAQWYATQRQRDCALKHSNGPYGENIFWGSGNDWTPAQAAMAWVAERKWYRYWSNSCAEGQECGHYTQIVWSSTKKVGCARVACFGGRGVFMTCNYDPPGNYIGERPY